MKDQLDIFELDSGVDYRSNRPQAVMSYLTPLNQQTHEKMERVWKQLTQGEQGTFSNVHV
jgi:cell division protein ZapE